MKDIFETLRETGLWKALRKNKIIHKLVSSTFGVAAIQSKHHKMKKALDAHGMQSIFDIDNALGKEKCFFFVAFGTLLGFVRDGGITPWDLDVDFGIHITDDFQWKDLQETMDAIDFKLYRQFSYGGEITEQAYIRNNVSVDFFAFYDRNDTSYCYDYYRIKDYDYKNENDWHTHINLFSKIDETAIIAVKGGKVHAPKNYEEFLKSAYTDNWRVPDPNWSSYNAPNTQTLDELGTADLYDA